MLGKGLEMPSKIVFLAPERLHAIIVHETQAGRRPALAEGILRLLELHARYLTPPDPEHRVSEEPPPDRLGTLLPQVERKGESILQEIDWGIISNPVDNGYGGVRGEHVLNGALIQHSDHSWMIHT